MEFEDLSPQVLSLIVQGLDYDQLNQLCLLNPELNQKICKNDEFWQQKYLREFGFPRTSPLIWREAYRQKLTNQVFVFGANRYSQLGLVDDRDRWSPEGIFFPEKIISFSAGSGYSLILTEDGQVYAFGANTYGQLGFGDRHNRYTPKQIPFRLKLKEKIISISVGDTHSLILTENGQVYAFGNNDDGQLGLGDELDRLKPERIPFGLKAKEKITSISAGSDHSLVLTEDGQVYAFGRNFYGQLGLGDQEDRWSPELIPFSQKITAISAGFEHSLILTKDGQVYAFGSNKSGRLGLGDQENRLSPEQIPFSQKIISISAGDRHSLILTGDGFVYAFGKNKYGQLGLGDQRDRWSPEKISFGLNPKEKIISISTGRVYSLILTEDGFVYAFGLNRFGQLGLGDKQDRWSPEKISFGLKPKEKIVSISAGRSHNLILAGTYALFSSIETLIQKNWVKNYELKYRTSENTAILEFIDLRDQSYLIEVIYDPETNEIFELK